LVLPKAEFNMLWIYQERVKTGKAAGKFAPFPVEIISYTVTRVIVLFN
jgi:hypothetical protein